LENGRDERRVLTEYIADCVAQYNIGRPRPVPRFPTSVPVVNPTLGEAIDDAYPFARGVARGAAQRYGQRGVAHTWSVPLPLVLDIERDVYKSIRKTQPFLSGLKIRFDKHTDSLYPALPYNQARLSTRRVPLSENPGYLRNMWQVYALLVQWVDKMEAGRKVIPLVKFLHQQCQDPLDDGYSRDKVKECHERWCETNWLNSMKYVRASNVGVSGAGAEEGEESDEMGEGSSDGEESE
jgi:hypothetical protein